MTLRHKKIYTIKSFYFVVWSLNVENKLLIKDIETGILISRYMCWSFVNKKLHFKQVGFLNVNKKCSKNNSNCSSKFVLMFCCTPHILITVPNFVLMIYEHTLKTIVKISEYYLSCREHFINLHTYNESALPAHTRNEIFGQV